MENVEQHLKEILKSRKVHLTLIDPDEQSPEEAVEIAKAAIAGGSDGIMLGGSTVDSESLDGNCKALSENIDAPIILFPGNTNGVSKYADALFFMSVLNSRNPYWIIGAQALSTPAVKKSGVEIILSSENVSFNFSSIFTPNASRQSAVPQFDEAARLPCFAILIPSAAATNAATVEMLKELDLSPPVPTISRALP